MKIDFKCDDFLKENQHWYAIKAKRKRISLIRIEAMNRGPTEVRLDLGSSRLTAGGKEFTPAKSDVVFRKLSEFTWDFLGFALLDFHPFLALFDLTLFLFGPLYNRRLKRQLASLSDGELLLSPGETNTVLIAFRGVKAELGRLTLPYRNDQGLEECLQSDINESRLFVSVDFAHNRVLKWLRGIYHCLYTLFVHCSAYRVAYYRSLFQVE